MQFRRTKHFLATLLLGLTGAASLIAVPALVWADAVMKPPPLVERELRSRAARADLRTFGSSTDPDTVWIGHIADSVAHAVDIDNGTPGNLTDDKGDRGGYGPYHIGRGPNRIIGGRLGTNAAYNGVWDFDHLRTGAYASTPAETDSLMGWWPITCPFGSVGPTNFADVTRPWFCLDYGNIANYVINQGSPKRTFGVVGIWHEETGAGGAWCGLNAHGVNTPTDNITGNPFNADVMQYIGENSGRQTGSRRTAGTDALWPGYGSQWDQLLYRDIIIPAGQDLYLSWTRSTEMDTRKNTTFNSQAGWFSFDPYANALSPSAHSGISDFISANNTLGHPADSFMVYVGRPIEQKAGALNDFTASDGNTYDIYDPLRRWMSEVVDINNVQQLEGLGGTNASAQTTRTITSGTVNTYSVDADGAGAGTDRAIRVVFRVKTNRGFDDEHGNAPATAFNSTWGAAVVSECTAKYPTSAGTTIFAATFAGSDIDNTNSSLGTYANAGAANKFHSTGKPPGQFFHLHDYASLSISDPCGAATESIRFCNAYGKSASPGDHDLNDKLGGGKSALIPKIRYNSSDRQKWFVSPTINLCSTSNTDYNGMGINDEISKRKLVFVGDQVYNVYNYPVTGNGFRYTTQAYPSNQSDGTPTWGDLRKTFFFNFITTRGCFETIIGIPSEDALIRHSNGAGNPPDSIRVGIEAMARCYALPISDANCSPTSGPNSGGPYDNLSVGFATSPPPPPMAITIWDLFNDSFPVNWTNQIPTSTAGNGFDTTSTLVKTGFNDSDNTGLSGANGRHNVPGDSSIVQYNGNNKRVDLVFRILPGVGNYATIGNRGSGLVHRVTVAGASRLAAGNIAKTVAGGGGPDTSFWSQYMYDNGAYGTGGNGTTGPGHTGNLTAKSGWDENRWNSARCDTAERNYFPRGSLGVPTLAEGVQEGFYCSMYHESDPKASQLGIRHNRCFAQLKITGSGSEFASDERFIRCAVATNPGNLGNEGTWPPTPYTGGGGGLPASEGGGNPYTNPGSQSPARSGPNLGNGETYEGSKILPDGLFTPGTHIEYFFRASEIGNTTAFDMGPDTNYAFPQTIEGSFDYHRWREFSVLPNRWNDSAFPYGGTGMACMLVVDVGDRRADEPVWVSLADSIGLTTSAGRGAHNGWSAATGTTVEGNIGTNTNVAKYQHIGQAGSRGIWDFYQTVAGESNVPSGRLGSRYANESNPGVEAGKFSKHGPSQAMLLNFYKTMVVLTADLAEETFGPLVDETDDDVALLTSFLTVTGADPSRTLPRGLLMAGTDMVDGATGTSTDLVNFFDTQCNTTIRYNDYRQNGGIQNNAADLTTTAFNISGATPMPASTVQTYGVFNPCFLKLDVLNALSGGGGANGQVAARYENTGSANSPYTAAVYSNDDGSRDARTYIMGWTLGYFGGMGTRRTATSALLNQGTQRFMFDLLSNIWSAFNCKPSGAAVGIGDDPGANGRAFVNFMNLRSENPMRSGEARIAFGLTKTEKVEVKVYDVSGRLVKTLANRIFPGGIEHVVIWDGTNDNGHKVARGVYFYQLRSPSFVSQKKLAVLKN